MRSFSVDATHYSSNGTYYQTPVSLIENTGFSASAVQFGNDASYYTPTANPSQSNSFTSDALVCGEGTPYYLPNTSEPLFAPSVPQLATTPTSTTIVMIFNGGFVFGEAPKTFSFLWGTTSNPTAVYPAVNVFGSLYSGQFTGLAPNTTYFFRSVVTDKNGQQVSAVSVPVTTASAGGTPPSGPPSVPTQTGSTSTTISVTFDVAGITGSAPITYGVLFGPIFIPAVLASGTTYNATITGLSPSTPYTFKSVAQNSVGQQASASSAPMTTSAVPALQTNLMTTFLVQGPIFNTPYSTALNYYINCDFVGGPTSQLFGSWYAKTSGTIPPGFEFAPSWDGLVLNDNTGASNAVASGQYISPLQGAGCKAIVSFGGFYADVLGLFGPYQPAGYPGTNPSVSDLMQSLCYTFYGKTDLANPLVWSNAGWLGQRFDGLNLDFENIGQGGNPSASNQYPLPQSPAPQFPADVNALIPGSSITYSQYISALNEVAFYHHLYAPDKILNHAPLSASINAVVLGNQGGKNVAVTTALNTWFAFPDFSPPTTANYNSSPSPALNHPDTLKYFDDVFVQYYNEDANNYLGGVNFPILLAQWGYVCLVAQGLGVKRPRVNIGLAKGDGSTPDFNGGPYFYPRYKTASPPNPNATQPPGHTYPNIGQATDAKTLNNAIAQATTLLRSSGLPGCASFVTSDWCNGGGFWAGGDATIQATTIFSEVPLLPAEVVYCWSDAIYPAPDPLWKQNCPISI